jgi:hypothetical protein
MTKLSVKEVLSPSEAAAKDKAQKAAARKKKQEAARKAAERRKIPVKEETPEDFQDWSGLSEKAPPLPDEPVEEAPPMIRSNPERLKQWASGTKEERTLASLLCDLNADIARTGIDSYFTFFERVETIFPKGSTKSEEKIKSAVKKAAALAEWSPSKVYQILSTVRVYRRETYNRLAAEAEKNGVTIHWTHLRTLAWRLGDPQQKIARKTVEKELVSRKLSEKQLQILIDETAPETVKQREEQQARKPVSSRIASFLSALNGFTRKYSGWLQILSQWENEWESESEEDVLLAKEQADKAADLLRQMQTFVEEGQEILETVQKTVTFLAEKGSEPQRKQTEETAERINSRVQQRQQEEQLRQQEERKNRKLRRERQEARLELLGEFSEDDTPRVVERDLPPAGRKTAPPDEEDEEDADSFRPGRRPEPHLPASGLYEEEEEEEEWEAPEDEYADEELVDEDVDDELFDEVGNVR